MEPPKMNGKRPRRKGEPKGGRKPTAPPITSTQNVKLVWKVSRIDASGKWGWQQITCPYFLSNIWEKMHNFETMTWAEILGSEHHRIPISNIIRPAQKRLEELGHDDAETLVSFRITGRQRIWAIRSDEKAFLLWWDPEHEICPAYLRYT